MIDISYLRCPRKSSVSQRAHTHTNFPQILPSQKMTPPLISTVTLDLLFLSPVEVLKQNHWQVLPPLLQMASLVAQRAKNLPAVQETQVLPLGREDPGEGHGNPLQCSCLENPTAEEPGGLQSVAFTKELDMTEQLILRCYSKCSSKSGHTVAHSRPASQSKPL